MELDPETEAAERKSYKKESFAQAFDRNRKAGEKTFVWQGKEYTTEMAKPKPRPAVSDTYRKEGEGRGTPETPTPKRAEIPVDSTAKAPPSTGRASMSETERNVLNTLGAMGGVAGRATGLASRAARAEKAAEAPRRVEPTMGRATSEARSAAADGRIEPYMTREPRDLVVEANRRAAREAAEESARRKPEFRSRTADRMDEREAFKRGGSVKGRGDGCAQRGHTKGRMV